MYIIILICMILIIIIILYNNNIRLNNLEEDININNYKIKSKKCINLDDKYNIKQYDIINDNIIIHSKYKNELLNLKQNKLKIDQEIKKNEEIKIKERNQKIKINSEKIKKYEFQQRIEQLKLNIKSMKLLLKNELNGFLVDYNKNLISSDEIQNLISQLNIELQNNNKIIDNNLYNEYDKNDVDEYFRVIQIKNKLLNKKINIYSKFLK